MDAAALLKLEKVLAKGKWHFVLFHGVLRWGVLTALLFCVFKYVTHAHCSWLTIKLAFITFPLAGMVWGAFMWWYLNRKMHQYQL
ncbi:hypothetical protein [Shewanella youngdeokensis]|uniref:Uncharacterized protein n=1 Tax=Shewanella youngdeokensis TaxID=2999068 RepID=A0ABZ0JXM8_9GAMM|nr:hypothetical protein RGE70_14505 [Shewanella sp. DAU334]